MVAPSEGLPPTFFAFRVPRLKGKPPRSFEANDGEPLASSGKRGTVSEEIVFCNSTPQPLTCSSMPLYEYICRKCRHKFDEVLTIKEHETKKPQCPKCQSSDLEKVIEPFFAKTSSKTRRY